VRHEAEQPPRAECRHQHEQVRVASDHRDDRGGCARAAGRVEARLRGVGFRQSFGYDALWTAGYSRAGPALRRTDPATGKTRAYPLPCLKQFGLAVGAGGVWVSGVYSARGALPGRPPYFSLVRADPATGQVTARYPARPSPLDIVAGNRAVWHPASAW
jgi:hypothetical protein